MKKIIPSHKYTIILFVIIFLLLEFVLWGLFGTKWWNLDGKSYVDNGMVTDIIYTIVNMIVVAGGFIFYYFKSIYYIDNKMIKIPGRKKEYFFKDIIYLDEEYTEKNSEIKIYVEGSGFVSLVKDNNNELLEIIKKNANLKSKEEFIRKHPNVII